MKPKAQQISSPTTPDLTKSWLKTRGASNRTPNSPPNGPPSPSPNPRTSRRGTPAMNPNFTQIGGIAQAGQAGQVQNSYFVGDELNNLWATLGNGGDVGMQGSGGMALGDIHTGDGNGNGNGNGGLPLSQTTSASYTSISNMQLLKNFLDEKENTLVKDTNGNEDEMHVQYQHQSLKQGLGQRQHDAYEDSTTQFIQESQSTSNDNYGTRNSEGDTNPDTNVNPTFMNPNLNLPDPNSTLPTPRIVMLPSTNPSRPLAPGDEVHLLDPSSTSTIHPQTYRITSIDLHGNATIIPIITTLSISTSRLLRAPLADGDIVGVFQDVQSIDNGKVVVGRAQVDWGSVVARWVVDGVRRYRVVSWDGFGDGDVDEVMDLRRERKSKVWEVGDGEVGWFDVCGQGNGVGEKESGKKDERENEKENGGV